MPLADLVTDLTGLPTVIENDVVASTCAEPWFGQVRSLSRFAVITIGIGGPGGAGLHHLNQWVTLPSLRRADKCAGLIGEARSRERR